MYTQRRRTTLIMRLRQLLSCTLLVTAVPAVAEAAGSSAHERLRQLMLLNDYPQAAKLAATLENPNLPLADGSTLLGWAVDMQDSRMVTLLLDAGADPDAFGTPASAPLLVACQHGDEAVLAALLKAGVDVNVLHPEGGTSALALCAANASAAIVEQLLRDGAEVDLANRLGQTPLMWAAQAGNVDSIRLLLAHGAKLESTTDKGLTPLFFALKSGNPQAAQLLAEAGANLNHVAGDGTTLVQMAMYQKAYGFAEMLITQGKADLTAFDRNGNQLLHAAVLAQQPQLVSLLLRREAQLEVPTGPSQVEWRYEGNFRDGQQYVAVPKTPLQLAEESKHAEIMQLLLDAGAKPLPPAPAKLSSTPD